MDVRWKHLLLVAAILFGGSLAASEVSAQTRIYDWPSDQYPVLMVKKGTLLFVDKDKKVSRAYSWRAENGGEVGRTVYVVDVNQEGGPEIVGSGTPTFVLNTDSNAIWAHKEGCEQLIVANFVADDKLDMMCNNGKELKVYTYDGQFVWSLSLGRRIEYCRAGDWNGDLMADLECKYRGRSTYARVESDGSVIQAEVDEHEIDKDQLEIGEVSPSPASLLEGKQHFDLDGDGHPDERINADGNAVVIGSKAKDKALARVELDGEAQTAVVKDVDGDGKKEIYVATSKTLYVIGPDGKKIGDYPTSARRYDRSPLAELKSVYANGFGENNEKAQKTVDELQDKLSRCYADRVRRNPFAGTGQMLLQVAVDEKGGVKKVNKVHTDITDKDILECAKSALERGDYPKAKGSGSINVNINYTFVDKP